MKSIYNVEYRHPRHSVYHWETAVEAENRTQAANHVKTMHGNVVIGQIRFVGRVGVSRTREQIIEEAQSGHFEL